MRTRDQIKAFERWQRTVPPNTALLVRLVIDEVVPLFRARGFERFPDYAGGSAFAVGPNCIPLQRRKGIEWPTVEVLFDKRYRPSFGVTFALLPEDCVRIATDGPVKISRLQANVVEGPAFFYMMKGTGRNFEGNWGIIHFSFRPQHKIRAEVEALKSLLPWLFDIFDNGIPASWLASDKNYRVDRHAFLSPASRFLHAAKLQEKFGKTL